VLIVAPPAESKAPWPEGGPPVDLDELSFPELATLRLEVLEALAATSQRPDAFERLWVRPSMIHDVAMNAHVRELPCMPAHELYTGSLHEGLDVAGLSEAAADRVPSALVFVSALWGALRPTDRIPRYRLHLNSYLVGIDRLQRAWRTAISDVLAAAAGPRGVVVDLRSPVYQAMGMPAGLGSRTITLKVDLGRKGHRIGDVIAKRVRGEAAHVLLESGADPDDPDELAEVLSDRWPVRLHAPDRRDEPWSMTLSVTT
jgi:uncharacterized protein